MKGRMRKLKHKDWRQTLKPWKERTWCCGDEVTNVQNNKSNKSTREGRRKGKRSFKCSNFFSSQIGSQGIVRAHGLKQPVLPSEGIKDNTWLTETTALPIALYLPVSLTKLTARVTPAKGVLWQFCSMIQEFGFLRKFCFSNEGTCFPFFRLPV